jgi:AsmA-like C-terminal region
MRSVLAACRRILLAVLAVLVLLGGWLYWQAPSLNTLRPELEHLLAAQLGLKELHLGHLSWRWAGYTWLDADSIAFVGAEQRILVTDARLEVRLSTWDLIRGVIRPTSISLRHGSIVLHIPKAAANEAFPLPSGLLRIEDSSVTMDYGAFSNRFEHLDLLLDADHRSLGMQLPGFTLDVAWNTQLQPEYVHAEFDNLQWMPERWRPVVHGAFSASLQLDKAPDNTGWELLADIKSAAGATIQGGGHALLVVNQLYAQARVHSAANPLDVTAIDWQRILWQGGGNRIVAEGKWADGRLQMQLHSPVLQLPVLAAWAMPLADGAWRAWLAGLAGTAKDSQAELHLRQDSPWGLPQLTELRAGDVLVKTSLSDASIPLTSPGEVFQGLSGSLSLGAKGLDMQVSSVQLPLQAGVVHGQLHIAKLVEPVFEMQGQGMVDVGLCERWLQVNALPQVVWKASPADASFNLSWPMAASLPDKGAVDLVPQPTWQAEIMQHPVSLHNGKMRWKAGKGLSIQGMSISDGEMEGRLELAVQRRAADGAWQMTSLHLASSGDFAELAKRMQMPLDGAAGRYSLSVDFDAAQQKTPWQFTVDFKDAAWRRLLGSAKKPGQLYVLQATGMQAGEKIRIGRIASRGVSPMISGSGELSRQLALLQITTLQAPAFSGSVAVRVPLGDAASKAPLEIDIDSDFLDQAALPEQIPGALGMPGVGGAPGAPVLSNWVMRGHFKHIRWDAVALHGVHVYFASATQGIGRLEADELDAAQFSIHNVRTFFNLGSGRHMDIRHLEAIFLGQHINLSGTIGPESGGGLRWTGFADINGDFSQIIRRLDAAKLFQGGTLHAHWSGSGVIGKDQPWWNDMHGRLRMRSDDGRILEGGTMTKLLAALNLADLPKYLTGSRKDITGPGMLYKRLQLEATVQGERADIRQLAMRASALDMGGKGRINLASGSIDLYVVAHPLQNIDALLNMIPLLRDVILGPAKSVFRKIYHVYGSLYDAKVEAVSAEQAGLPSSGLLEQLISLPGRWFDAGKNTAEKVGNSGF